MLKSVTVLAAVAVLAFLQLKPFTVEYKGALRQIMHEGDLSAKADLREFKEEAHLYALGAVKDLKGEILVMDGKPMVSRVESGQLQIDRSFEHEATLLVYSKVEAWQEISIPASVKDYSSLEIFIEKAAANASIDTEEPFPFLIEGKATSADWHVIDWDVNDKVHTHEKHKKAGLHGTLKNRDVEILGFYSKHHHAIFTHHSTNMHLHVRTRDMSVAGHLDAIRPGSEMTLKIPAM